MSRTNKQFVAQKRGKEPKMEKGNKTTYRSKLLNEIEEEYYFAGSIDTEY